MERNDDPPGRRQFGESLPTDGPDETDWAVAELLTVLARKHSFALLAMFAADPGPWRFDDIKEVLEISTDTLSSRLSEFEELGLVSRKSYHVNPPRVEYTATEDAEGLRPVFRQLYQWEDDRGYDRGAPKRPAASLRSAAANRLFGRRTSTAPRYPAPGSGRHAR